MEKELTILGSTGSIGTQSLMVCRNLGLKVGILAGGKNVKLLEQQAREFRPRLVVIAEDQGYAPLKAALADLGIRVAAGKEALCEAAAEKTDVLVNAIVGIAGLRPTLAALEAGARVALANKESLVTGGALVMAAAKARGGKIVPVDSEHSAIFQCLQGGSREDVEGVVLTASGGPFAGKTKRELADVEISCVLAHPNWNMGAKISVDSATMANKGFELMEAMWLFDLAPEQIEIVVHRQSIVHSAVAFRDGSVIAQMGEPDMRMAIQYALTWPRRYASECKRLSLFRHGSLTFEKPDLETFSCLATCIEAARAGGLAPAVVNGANEEAVALFLEGKIKFLQIGELVAGAMDGVKPGGAPTLEAIEQADLAARAYVREQCASSVQEQ